MNQFTYENKKSTLSVALAIKAKVRVTFKRIPGITVTV